MSEYAIIISDEAKKDIDNLTDIIMYEYQAPFTAFKYMQELLEASLSLSHTAEAYPVQSNHSFRKYGQYVRRINYKKMAIIYTVHGTTVYIQRVIPASVITEL
jgi:plasmid stabilization system protein ParE